MKKIDRYESELSGLVGDQAWREYLEAHSGLPGPRGNLELLRAFVRIASAELAQQLAAIPASLAPVNDPMEFLAACGTAALGRVIASLPAGSCDFDRIEQLMRQNAGDGRWRVREAAAMALQFTGRVDYQRMMDIALRWAEGTELEQRAAAAAVAEPDLLCEPGQVVAATGLLARVTASLAATPVEERRGSESFRVLRLALGYCWSVAAAADFAVTRPHLESWLGSRDRDVRWLMAQNLSKTRLVRTAPAWVEAARQRLALADPDAYTSRGATGHGC